MYIPDFAVAALYMLLELREQRVTFLLRLDSEDADMFAMMTEMGFFAMTGQRYQMVIPKRLNMTKLAVVDDRTPANGEFAGAFQKRAKELGASIVLAGHITQGDKDFSAFVTQVKGSGAQALFTSNYYAEAGLLAARALSAHFDHVTDQAGIHPGKLNNLAAEISHEADDVPGFVGRPMQRADVERKFRGNIGKRWPRERTDAVLQARWGLDRADDIAQLLGRLSLQATYEAPRFPSPARNGNLCGTRR